MIIILSPAKTFNKIATSYETKPAFQSEANLLISKLQSFPVSKLMSKMNLSNALALQTLKDYKQFNQTMTAAIHGYDGYQYRHLNVFDLEEKGYKKQIKSIYILSALYGLLNAYDGISPYRLEMKDKTLFNLYHFWQPKITHYLQEHFSNEIIYNLASEEYGKIIKQLPNVITIMFYENNKGKHRIHAMEAKRLRGLFAKYVVMHPHTPLKAIVIDKYQFDQKQSTAKTYIYVRHTP